MKKLIFGIICAAAGAAAAAFCIWIACCRNTSCPSGAAPVVKSEGKTITGYGFIRGASRTVLKNKYGAYIKKVNFLTDSKVKKGDCIIEYDDLDLRGRITTLENEIASVKRELALQITQQNLTKLDPLPSDFRNISWKTRKAKELLDRTENEWRTYQRLFKSKSVSELDMRSKKQAYQDALASYNISIADQEKVKMGLSNLYIKKAEQNTALLKTKLDGLLKDLAILKEEQKYYKIVAPYDGVIVVHSDTVHEWDDAGNEVACLHEVKDGYSIYAYFEEKDIARIVDGTPARFFSNDNGKWYEAKTYEVKREKTVYGDKVFHLVKLKITSPVGNDIRMEGSGVIVI